MEEEKEVETIEEVEETKPVETQPAEEAKEDGEKATEAKTFTQKELDDIIQERLAKVKKSLPDKEKLEAFSKWEESQKTETEKQQAKEQGYIEKIAGLEKEIKTSKAKSQLADVETLDYVLFEVAKLQGEDVTFEDALEEFFKNKPSYKAGTKQTATPQPKQQKPEADEDPFIQGFKSIKK